MESPNINITTGKVQEILDRTIIRKFEAYLEPLDRLEDLLNYTEPVLDKAVDDTAPEGSSPTRPEHINDSTKLFNVINFSIKNSLDTLPRCSVMLPAGKFVTNLYRKKSIVDNYRFDPVPPFPCAQGFKQQTLEYEEKENIGFRPYILWYREHFRDTDVITDNAGKFKPIFKGVLRHHNFTRVAHRQESIIIELDHFACLLDTMFIHNAFLNTQAESSAYCPHLLQNPVKEGRSFSSTSNPQLTSHGRLLDHMIGRQADLPLNTSIYGFLEDTVETYKKYPTIFETLSSHHGTHDNIERITGNNINFLKKLIDFLEKNHEQVSKGSGEETVYASEPILNKETVGSDTSPGPAFYEAAHKLATGHFNGTTYLQCMMYLAKYFSLAVVCTANTVSFEAIRFRTHSWPLEPIDSNTCIYGTRPFGRELAGSVLKLGNTKPLTGTNMAATLSRAGSASDEAFWGAIHIDEGISEKDEMVLGSLMLFELPRWYNCGFTQQDLMRKVIPQGRSTELKTSDDNEKESDEEQTQPPPNNGGSKRDAKTEASLHRLLKSLHFQHKMSAKAVTVIMPFNINICVGMPLCIKDSQNGIYCSGIVVSFIHTICQMSLTAQTVVYMQFVDTFVYPKKKEEEEQVSTTSTKKSSNQTPQFTPVGAAAPQSNRKDFPDKNPKANEEDDKNPYFNDEKTNAFTGRPMYM